MSQHDMNLANAPGASFRADMNSALEAIVTNSSGDTEPTTTFPLMFWADTTSGKLKLRTIANDAWIIVGTLDSANLGLSLSTHNHSGVYEPVNTNIVKKNVATVFTAQQTPMNGALTPGATIDWDGNVNGQVVSLALNQSATMNAPTNIVQHSLYVLRVTQDATGSRLLSWDAAYKFGGSGAPTLTTTASKTDFLLFVGGAGNTLEFAGSRLDAV